MSVRAKAERRPARRNRARFPRVRRAYAAFAKALAKKAGVSAEAVDRAIREYGVEAAKRAAEAAKPRPSLSARLKALLARPAGLLAKARRLWARR
ncbi:MAG: hypothetical protein TU35_004165 [Thermoproteus sp. AZ2]|jgi:hypothetical protein|uniref:Uncharacterized protein n=1 Tax=Thermoproteus sp. AZ2 TaxID=1609232 RepID=A0ACC6V050_9CREN|nr:MAG: hypothetical protein TU35_02800 [Thermoproteus sp. AZ2]